jgi:hypothetical protein
MLIGPKIIKIAKFITYICGGWWSLMSGALSIPFAHSHASKVDTSSR